MSKQYPGVITEDYNVPPDATSSRKTITGEECEAVAAQ